MPSSTLSSTAPVSAAPSTCTCGGSTTVDETTLVATRERGRRLVHLDRAVGAGQVTAAEAAERRGQLLAR